MSDAAQLPLNNSQEAGARWFLLTNTLNLRSWMSRRMAFGRAGFDKYYADVPDLADGHLVVFPGPPGRDLIGHVTSEAPDLVPALVEVAPAGVKAVADLPEYPVRVAAPIHEGYLGPVLLPDETAVTDFTSRGFENVPASLEVLAAPELFEGGRWSMEDVGEPPQAGATEAEAPDLTRLDRLSGGLIGLAAATRCRPSEFSTLAAALLGRHAPDADQREPLWLVDEEADSDEAAVFRAVKGVLLETDPVKDWRPSDVLDHIQTAIEELSLTDDVMLTAGKYCERIRTILKAEADLEPLRPGGLRPLKAILLVLLRRELHRQLAWDVRETGASPAEARTAAYYSGILSRRSRLPLDLRPDGLDLFLAGRETTAAGGPVAPGFEDKDVRTEAADVEGQPGYVLKTGDVILLERPLGAVSIVDRIRATLASEDRDETALGIAEAAGWHDLITTVVGPVSDVRLVAEKKGQVVLHITGTANVRQEVDSDALWPRLSDLGDGDVPPRVVERLKMPSPADLDALEREAVAQ